MSQVGAVTAPGNDNQREGVPTATRVAAGVSIILGCTGVAYWAPALAGAMPPGAAGDHPVAFIQRVVSVAQQQYTPAMSAIVPFLGLAFSLASALQIPGGIGTLLGRRWGMLLLRTIAWAKVAMYVAAGLLLGLAIFSSVEADRPSWTFAALNWVAGLAMIGIYYWIIIAMNAALRLGEPEPLDDLPDDDPLPTPEPYVDRYTHKY